MDLQELLTQRDKKLGEAQQAQADIIRKQRELDDAKREVNLTIEKGMQEGLASMRDQARKEVEAQMNLEVLEKECIDKCRRLIMKKAVLLFSLVFIAAALMMCEGFAYRWAPTDKSAVYTNKSSYVVTVHTKSGNHTDDFALQVGDSHTVVLYGQQWWNNPVEEGYIDEESWQPYPDVVEWLYAAGYVREFHDASEHRVS